MIVLHANNEQYQKLNGYKNDFVALEFVKDGLDRWVIGTQVLEDENLKEIHDQLNQLEKVEYIPIEENE
jgi:hypothetical protein